MATRTTRKTGRYSAPTPRPAERKRTKSSRKAAVWMPPAELVEVIEMPVLSPAELYRIEKAKRALQQKGLSSPVEDAKREYLAMLESQANATKGGRPKKNKAAPAADLDEMDEEALVGV